MTAYGQVPLLAAKAIPQQVKAPFALSAHTKTNDAVVPSPFTLAQAFHGSFSEHPEANINLAKPTINVSKLVSN
jgi:hypothetical protein